MKPGSSLKVLIDEDTKEKGREERQAARENSREFSRGFDWANNAFGGNSSPSTTLWMANLSMLANGYYASGRQEIACNVVRTLAKYSLDAFPWNLKYKKGRKDRKGRDRNAPR